MPARPPRTLTRSLRRALPLWYLSGGILTVVEGLTSGWSVEKITGCWIIWVLVVSGIFGILYVSARRAEASMQRKQDL